MTTPDFTATLLVDQTPEEVFKAINNVGGWWTETIEGRSQQVHDEFEVRFGDVHYSKQKLIDVVPSKKVVWLVTDSYLSFTRDNSEWTGTQVSFDISEKDGKTVLHFTHFGLMPDIECYDACSNAWGGYIRESLFRLITKGEGKPAGKEEKKTLET